ncbi:hypothetical protein N476_25470 [Pseudoalteromonas luteoviolacea H33]|uniref:Uncharacterized protein n=1 Tax=Pseudoalteromonas luteoviolacea H33 TaxID=1365251 RepID=A0A167AMH4_9GAMM|nr:hypothetical protein N476_25470 [Pseudoalteromonas luteoviolacea H33]KZN69544.1 hypothetical protein N477_26220 [Pseudoalteromonas luteoviolacea H33-S]
MFLTLKDSQKIANDISFFMKIFVKRFKPLNKAVILNHMCLNESLVNKINILQKGYV